MNWRGRGDERDQGIHSELFKTEFVCLHAVTLASQREIRQSGSAIVTSVAVTRDTLHAHTNMARLTDAIFAKIRTNETDGLFTTFDSRKDRLDELGNIRSGKWQPGV